MTFDQFQLLFIVVGVFALLVGLQFYTRARRRRNWIQFAEKHGFSYFDENGTTADGDSASARDVQGVKQFESPLLSGGYHKHVLLKRVRHQLMMVCDYVWYRETRSHGQRGATRASTTTAVAIRDPEVQAPAFRIQWQMTTDAWPIRAEQSLPDVTEQVGADQSGLRVFCDDASAISALITPALIDAVCHCDHLVRKHRGDVLVFDADRELKVSDADALQYTAREIAGLLRTERAGRVCRHRPPSG